MARDRRVTRQLRGRGWKVIRIWQHSLKKSSSACLTRIRRALNSAEQNLEVVPVSASVKTTLGRSGLQVQLSLAIFHHALRVSGEMAWPASLVLVLLMTATDVTD